MADRPPADHRTSDAELFRLLAENVRDYAIFVVDADRRVLTWSLGAERLLGYRADQIVGRSADCFYTPDDIEKRVPWDEVRRALDTGRSEDDGWHVRKDGSRFWSNGVTTPLRDEAGRLRGFARIMRDRTDLKRAEDARQEAERRRAARLAVTQILAEAPAVETAAPAVLRAVCESLGWDIGLFWTVAGNGRALQCLATWQGLDRRAPAFEAISRARTFQPGEGLPGRVWANAAPAWLPDVTCDDNFPRAAIAASEGLHGAFGCPVRVGHDVLGAIEFFSHEIREPDADLLELMATVAGQIGQFMQRKRAESERRESEQRFARFMQHLPGLAWAKDLDGRYVFANDAAAKAFGRDWADIHGRTDEQVFAPETAAQFRANDEQALAGAVQVVETLTYPDGTVHASLVSKFPIPGPDGAPALVGGMAIDITDRMRAEAALREADRLKDEFLAMLAHELRNPLAPVRNALHVMKLPGVDADTVAQVRDMAERQVRHMARLLDDLLDVSRISRGRIELRCEPVNVTGVIERAVEAVRHLLDERQHALTVSFPDTPPRVIADPTRLEQVLTNLLTNAAKYTDPGGKVWLTVESASRDGGRPEVAIHLRDTGIGIAAEVLPRVFDLFVQADRRLDRSQGGVGIGLTLVKKLVELHGGTVEAHSNGPGQGSEFVVRLPAVTGECSIGPTAATGPGAELPRRRVMVVDDNRDAADSLAVLLTLSGHEVRAAYDGPAALALAGEFRPSLVFLDIGMPGMDGYDVARHLRGEPALDGIALVALTGWGQDGDRRRASAAGFDRHLVKPIEPDAVRQLLIEIGR
jgi:PAS domain S-box-containing protein